MSESDHSRPQAQDGQLRFPLPTGTRVDHYVIREVLGAGGFGITYLAEHEALGKLYAIKEYFPHAFSYRHGRSVRATSTGDSTYKWGLERFITEARALARFKHPAIVDVASVFEANGTAYIVLAYESGVDMTQWLKQLGRPPSQDELDRLLTPLLAALEEVHRNNILHRDISPDNLLIREEGRPVLIDFGSARESVRGRARAMSAIVKHGYSPPEQYTSRPELQGPWTDIYALAATLYRAISGRLPPDATERMLSDELQPLARLARAPYRPGFLDAIDRGLRVKVEARPQSIVEWREALFKPEPLRQPPRSEGAQGSASRSEPGAGNARPRQQPGGSPQPGPSQRADAAGAAPSRGDAARPVAARGVSERIAPARAASERIAPAPAAGDTPHDGPAQGRSGDGSSALRGSTTSSGRNSIPKSERPDLGWLDQDDTVVPDDADNPPKPAASVAQLVTYGILGLSGGAIAGAVLSVVVASVVSTACFADNCIFRYAAICAAVGAVAGIFVGVRIAQQTAEAEAQKQLLGRGLDRL